MSIKTTAIILSGGRGTRFGTEIPKQYMKICDIPVLAYTLRAFHKSNIDEMIIVSAAEYTDLCRSIADEYGCSKVKAVVVGGKERYFSVQNGLKAAADLHLQEKDSGSRIALIHDGARPFISADSINTIIERTAECGACIAATKCTDTIKITDENGSIVSTTNRSLTWAAQTPQAFYLKDVLNAYDQVLAGGNDPDHDISHKCITDDAMVYQMAFPDRKVKVLETGPDNFKITSPSDIVRAEKLAGDLKNELFRLNWS